MRRRRFLAALATAPGVATAGCSGSDPDATTVAGTPTEGTDPTDTPTGTPTATESPTATRTGTPTDAPRSTATPGPQPAFVEGFEDGFGGWERAAHIGPEVDLDDFEWSVEVSGEQARTGERSLRIYNEGDYDDGTAWAVHPVSVEPGRYRVTVSAWFWSLSESFNTLRNAVMRLGPRPPEAEADFPDPGVNTTALGETAYGGLREPLHLAEGWREYRFEWTTPELTTDTLFVALGTTVVWETGATHYVDDVSVRFEPR